MVYVAGFRLHEECHALVASLMEITARRKADSSPTYAIFIDLQKAFDMIPHNGLEITCIEIKRSQGHVTAPWCKNTKGIYFFSIPSRWCTPWAWNSAGEVCFFAIVS